MKHNVNAYFTSRNIPNNLLENFKANIEMKKGRESITSNAENAVKLC